MCAGKADASRPANTGGDLPAAKQGGWKSM